MALNQKAIDELKQIYFKEFGEELSDREAWDMGINLINIFKAVSEYSCHKKVEDAENLTEDILER